MKEKKIPLRRCVVTGERLEKQLLIRVVRTPEGTVIIDETGRANGRGAYLKKDKSVILKAQKTKQLEKHLETTVNDEIYQKLLSLIDNDK